MLKNFALAPTVGGVTNMIPFEAGSWLVDAGSNVLMVMDTENILKDFYVGDFLI